MFFFLSGALQCMTQLLAGICRQPWRRPCSAGLFYSYHTVLGPLPSDTCDLAIFYLPKQLRGQGDTVQTWRMSSNLTGELKFVVIQAKSSTFQNYTLLSLYLYYFRVIRFVHIYVQKLDPFKEELVLFLCTTF